MATNAKESQDGVEFGAFIDEIEQERRDNQWIATALSSIFMQVSRTITMMRVYPKSHPLVDGLLAQVLERFDPIFEREDDVVVRLDANKLTSEWGHDVLVREEKGEFVWYSPYADGVVSVIFQKGLTTDDLQKFLWTINQVSQGRISSDDDTVTLLWELQLQTVAYFAVEGFVDGGSLDNFDGRTEPEAIGLVADAAQKPDGNEKRELDEMFNNLNIRHVDLFTRMQMEAQEKVVPPELRDQDLQYAFSVDTKTLQKMQGEWSAGADLEYRLIEALLSVIRTAPASKGAEKAVEIMISVIRQLLENEAWEGAVRILKLLDERRNFFGDKDFDPLNEVLAELSDPMRLDALLNTFQKEMANRDYLKELLLLLNHTAVQKQVIVVLGDSKRSLIGVNNLVDLLQAASNDENIRNIWHPDYIDNATYLTRLLGDIGNRDFEGWLPTPHLIRSAVAHASPDVRELALSINHPCWRDPTLAEKYLSPMSVDTDETIRKLALKLLGDHHPEIFRNAIRESLLSKKFMGRSHAELRFLMRIFYDSDKTAPEYLRSLLSTRGWFSEGAREFAKMSAAILVERGDQKGVELVKSRAGSFLTSPALRTSYKQALQRFGTKSLIEASTAEDA